MKLKLKLGTRKSLLAWAQSSAVARTLEKMNPGLSVELVGIETRGDQIQNVSLQSIEGKDFFVAELDSALQSGAVDLTVHSMKDLSLSRPSDLFCGAIPPRENPRDVVLWGPSAAGRLAAGKALKIGTSSPRRLENIPNFLKKALPRSPHATGLPELQWVEIRGNVNTRLSRVHENETSERYLDGVVLAFAGLIRLGADSIGHQALEILLKKVRWMVLPLKQCPAAPAQGALAVECRKEDLEVRKILEPLHSSSTAAQVDSERKLLAEWGGGCHQRFGATQMDSPRMGALLFIRGVKQDGTFVEQLRWSIPEPTETRPVRAWDGHLWRSSQSSEGESAILGEAKHERSFPVAQVDASSAVFIAHSRAFQGPISNQARIWTSGVSSWFHLAAQGIWVEGCAEGLGFESLLTTLREPVLNLPGLQDWTVLTHDQALKDWNQLGIPAISTYSVHFSYGEEAIAAIRNATHVFWSSGSQYNLLKEEVSRQAHHACGPGKTADRLLEAGMTPVVFPSVEEWKRWLSQ